MLLVRLLMWSRYKLCPRLVTGLPRKTVRRTKWTLNKAPEVTKKQYVEVEEDGQDTPINRTMRDIKHYLRTTEMPQKLRSNLIRSHLAELVESAGTEQLSTEYFQTINAVLAKYAEKGKMSDFLPVQLLQDIFLQTSEFYLAEVQRTLPPFMASLAQEFVSADYYVSPEVLVQIVRVGAAAQSQKLAISLAYLLHHRPLLDAGFTNALLETEQVSGSLSLDTFESILEAETSIEQPTLVNSDFVIKLIQHLEATFENASPNMHEYLDSNKNVYRIQQLVNKTIERVVINAEPAPLLRLLKCKIELNSITSDKEDVDSVNMLLEHCVKSGVNNDYQQIKDALFAHESDHDSPSEVLLSELSKKADTYKDFIASLCGFFLSDDIRFGSSLRLKAALLHKLFISHSKATTLQTLSAVYEPYISCCQLPNVLSTTVEVLSVNGVSGTWKLIQEVRTDLADYGDVEFTIYDYKTLIDNALHAKEYSLAYQLFEKSLTSSSASWTDIEDPVFGGMFSRLVVSLVQNDHSIIDVFPRFRKIKQHMSAKCDAKALHAMMEKMLAEGCVGDVIEMMKRELPSIDKDAYERIAVNSLFAKAHRELFNLLHEFVITYTKESTYETNWVLYGELHKYFHVPNETYLPAMKFFCGVGRLNAALLILRRMKMLSELHALDNVNLPPSREIYMYLLSTFGDKFYEEGVNEVHEYLKLDLSLASQDIELQNCILNAYSNLQNVGKARDLFLTIASNPKQHGGINEETVQIMIKTLTYSEMAYVKKFWNNLSQYGIFPNYGIYRQYLIAHTYHGYTDDAFRLVEEIDDYNIEFSSDLLLAMHNYCLEPHKQQEIVKWALENHNDEWQKLKQSGLLKSASPYMPEQNLIASEKR